MVRLSAALREEAEEAAMALVAIPVTCSTTPDTSAIPVSEEVSDAALVEAGTEAGRGTDVGDADTDVVMTVEENTETAVEEENTLEESVREQAVLEQQLQVITFSLFLSMWLHSCTRYLLHALYK